MGFQQPADFWRGSVSVAEEGESYDSIPPLAEFGNKIFDYVIKKGDSGPEPESPLYYK
jgi:hypothetical protein